MAKKPPMLFGVTPPGLESVLQDELRAHRFRSLTIKPGGVEFRGSPLKANRLLSCASRILMPIAQFDARDFDALVAGAEQVDWTPYGGINARVSSTRSRLYHTDAVAERLHALIGKGPSRLYCRLVHDRCTLKIDTTGEHLHKRGWRIESGSAPVRETLAARMLRLAGWEPGEALVDPMCGSGTIVIEAASRAAGLAPGRLRTFACESWWRSEAMPSMTAVPTLIEGSDRARGAVEVATRNAARAGVDIALSVTPAREAKAPAPTGLLVANPPYDRRVKGQAAAWDALRGMLRGPFAGWRAAILCPAPHLAKRLGRPIAQSHRLTNGGLPLNLLILDPQTTEA